MASKGFQTGPPGFSWSEHIEEYTQTVMALADEIFGIDRDNIAMRQYVWPYKPEEIVKKIAPDTIIKNNVKGGNPYRLIFKNPRGGVDTTSEFGRPKRR